MYVVSKLQCGFRQDGSVLLQKGDNHLEEPLLPTERAFINAMVLAKLVEIVPEVPHARSSGTKLKSSGEETPKRTMRVRRAAK